MQNKNFILFTALLAITSNSAFAVDRVFIKNKNQSFMHPAEINKIVNLNKNNTFKVSKEIKLQNGVIKHKLRQYYKNIPVLGVGISATQTNDGYKDLAGSFFSNIETDIIHTSKRITKSEAVNIALKAKGITSVNTIKNKKADLYILQGKDKKAHLVYLVSYFIDSKNATRPYFIIDVKKGEIIDSFDGLTRKDAIGPGGNGKTGKYFYGTDYPPMDVTDDCMMENDNVVTYDMQQKKTGGVIFQFTCPENTYKEINGGYSPLNDVHFFGTLVVNMYKDWYGGPPVPFKVRLNAHYWNNYYSSFWDGSAATFGDGFWYFAYPITSVDVVSHEISHGFTENNSNLFYDDQSGALNDGFSDIAGEGAKYYLNLDKPENERNDFLYAGAVFRTINALRYFEDPTLDMKSIDHVRDYNNDLDPHYSSGIYRKAFYTLATKENWNTKKAFDTFVLANQIYWHETTTFDEGGCGVARSAVDLGYSSDDVITSFLTVGIDADCLNTPPDPDPEPIGRLNNGIPINNLSATIGEENFWVITVPADRPNLEIKISGGTGDADLYTLRGSLPSLCQWDCRPFLAGNDEVCNVENPLPGDYYIMLSAANSYSGVTLEGNF